MSSKRLPKLDRANRPNVMESYLKPAKGNKQMINPDMDTERDSDIPSESQSPTKDLTPATKADLQHLVSKQDIATNFEKLWDKIDGLHATVTASLTEIKQDISDLGERIETLEEKQDTLVEDLSASAQIVSSHQQQLLELEDKIEDIENRNRRNNIRLKGVPESVGVKDLSTYLQQLFRAITGEKVEREFPIERAHRALRAKPREDRPPRDIIIKLLRYPDREYILAAARKNPTFRYQGVVIQFYQDLCIRTLQRRQALRPLTSLLQKNGISYRWGFPFALNIVKDGKTITLKDRQDIPEVCKVLHLEVPELLPEETSALPNDSGELRLNSRKSTWAKVALISFPLTNPMNEDDTKKVMRCIVEVISDTLSKPSPIPISQECLETLRGDERIISILRHQNLLKELQELAAQGATERSQKPKKSTGFEDELSEVLEKQNMKSIRSGKSEEIPAEDHERSFNGKSAESANRQPEEEGKTSSEQEFPENSREDDSGEELESNDISKREETSRDEEIDNRITDEINKLPTEPEVSEDTSESQSSEEKEVSNMNEKNIEASKADDSDNDKLNETDDEEDDTQREDNSMKLSEDQDEDKQEHMQEDETSKNDEDKEKPEAGNSHQSLPKSEEETSSKELEDSKRWNKMDELAKQLTSKKSVEENSSEEDPDQSMKNPLKDNYEATNHGSVERQPWQTSTEDSAPQIAKRPEPEERKEEEGSANRKTEDQELESLAAIEAELEKVAHKLHELRRG